MNTGYLVAGDGGAKLTLTENGESGKSSILGRASSQDASSDDIADKRVVGGGTKISSTRYVHYGTIDFVLGTLTLPL